MVPVGINYGLTSASHATDKSTELMLRKLGPLLNESLSDLPNSCWVGPGEKKWLSAAYPMHVLWGLNQGISLANPIAQLQLAQGTGW